MTVKYEWHELKRITRIKTDYTKGYWLMIRLGINPVGIRMDTTCRVLILTATLVCKFLHRNTLFPLVLIQLRSLTPMSVSYTHLRAHETRHDLVCRLLL